MSYNPEDEVSYDEISPTLRALIDGKASVNYVNTTVSAAINTATTNILNTVNTNIDGKVSTAITNLTNTIVNGAPGSNALKTYIDSCDFINFPPRVGFLDDKYVNISGSYNMPYSSVYENAIYATSDIEGREVIYFTAGKDADDTQKLFKATKMSADEAFLYDNNYIVAGYMDASTDFIQRIISLDNAYMTAYVMINGVQKVHMISTNGSSSQDKWTTYVDITSFASKFACISSIMKFDDYNTYAVVYLDGVITKLGVYNSSFGLLSTNTLFNPNTQFTPESGVTDSVSNYWWEGTSAAYIPKKEHLVIATCLYGSRIRQSDNITISNFTCMYLNIFSISKSFFKTGTGSIVSTIPNSNYQWPWNGSGVIGSSWGNIALVYDELDDYLRYSFHRRDTSYSTLYETAVVDNMDTTGVNYIFSNAKQTNITAPDTCPWAKILYSPRIIGEYIQLYCNSQKYGSVLCLVKPQINGTSRKISVTAGSWTTNCGVGGDPGICCAKISNNTANCYVVAASTIYKIEYYNRTDPDGMIKEGIAKTVDLGIAITQPTLPGLRILRSCYSPNTGKIYYLAQNMSDTTKIVNEQSYGYIIEYDIASRTTKDILGIPAWWKSTVNQSIVICGSLISVDAGSRVNMFMDNDGSLYFSIAINMSTGSAKNLFKLTTTGGNYAYSTISLPLPYDWMSQGSLGWNNMFGYYITGGGDSFTTAGILSSKDIVSGAAEKSAGDFFSGLYYRVYFGLAGSIGLMAIIQSQAIFLGGYYSTIPAQEVYLTPNADNYIYLSRDRYDRTKINVEVRTKLVGVIGETQFSRVLCTKITTNNQAPVSQTDYPINS